MFRNLICFLFVFFVIYRVNASVMIYWNEPVTGTPPNRYEVQLRNIISGEKYIYGTINTSLRVPIQVGSFEVMTRAVYDFDDGTALTSNWCRSLYTSCALLRNGKPGAWVLQRLR